MNINIKNIKQRIYEITKRNLLILLLVVFSCKMSFAAENITLETKDDNFFMNFITDTVLLLDPDLKILLKDDIENIVKRSKFELQPNSWRPKPNPKNWLSSVYSRITNNELKDTFADLVQPVVEIACTPSKLDPLNVLSSKCVKDMLTYAIIDRMQINYTYESKKTIEQIVAELSGLNSSNRYPQMICTAADIMNRAFEKKNKKNVVKTVNLIKNPIPLQSPLQLSPQENACRKNLVGHWQFTGEYFAKQIDSMIGELCRMDKEKMQCVINKYDAMGESRDYNTANQKFYKAKEVCK